MRARVERCLRKLAPGYLGLLETMDDAWLDQLHETITHWTGTVRFSRAGRAWFTAAKIVECLAFWTGFERAGNAAIVKGILVEPARTPGTGTGPTNHVARQEMRVISPREGSRGPRVAVVIPVGNSSPMLDGILGTTMQVLEHSEAVVSVALVLDGIEPEPINRMASSLGSTKTRIIPLPVRRGPAAARNAGIDASLALEVLDGVLFMDTDVIARQGALEWLIVQGTMVDGICCPLVGSTTGTGLDRYHDINGTLNGRYLAGNARDELLFGTTSCMLVPRWVLDDGLRFSTDFQDAAGEDIDFCLRAREAGVPIRPVDDVIVHHWYGYGRDQGANWHVFTARFERYGAGERVLLRRHPGYHRLLERTVERPTC